MKFTLTRIVFLLPALCWAASLAAQEEDAPPSAVEVVEVVEAAAAADEAVEVPADPLDAQAMQYEQMLLPKMWRELEFIKQHCSLTREQRPKIKAAAQTSVKHAAKELIRNRQGIGQGDVGAYIRKDLLKTLEKTLTREQLGRYQKENVRRIAALKKTTIHSVVAQLDGILYLTREQRDKISKAIDVNWKEEWEQWLVIWQYGGTYLPMIPDEHLVPHLNEQQKSVWRGAQKISPGFWGGGGLRQETNNDWWEGKEEADAKPAANEPKSEVKAK